MHAAVIGGHGPVVAYLLARTMKPSFEAYVGIKRKTFLATPSSFSDDRYTPIAAALQEEQASHCAVFDACLLLIDAGASQADGRLLMGWCIKQFHPKKRQVRALLDRGVRLDEVPICANVDIVDMLFRSGASLKEPEMLQHAVDEVSLDLLKYLETEHRLHLERALLPDYTMQAMLSARLGMSETYTNMPKYLLAAFGDVNRTFTYEEGQWTCGTNAAGHLNSSWIKKSGSTEKSDEDLVDGVETSLVPQNKQANLLSLACEEELHDGIDTLLTMGANIECPGLPHSALVYFARKERYRESIFLSESTEITFRVLLDQASPEVLRLFREQCADMTDHHHSLLDRFKQKAQLTSDKLSTSRRIALGYSQSLVSQYSGSADTEIVQQVEENETFRPFPYTPLTAVSTIRLLELLPAESSSEKIIGKLNLADLNGSVQFEAISYVWGDRENWNCSSASLELEQLLRHGRIQFLFYCFFGMGPARHLRRGDSSETCYREIMGTILDERSSNDNRDPDDEGPDPEEDIRLCLDWTTRNNQRDYYGELHAKKFQWCWSDRNIDMGSDGNVQAVIKTWVED